MGDAGHNDPSDVVLAIGGRQIKEGEGIDNWLHVTEVSHNVGPSGIAYGFNKKSRSNRVTFTVHVRATSEDMEYIRNLVATQAEVEIYSEVPQDQHSKYAKGEEIRLGGKRCVLSGGTSMLGRGDAEDVSFDVVGIVPIRAYVQ